MTMMLLPDCVLPGCSRPVAQVGDPCEACLADLGPFLARSDQPRITAEQIAERDESVLTIQRSRREPDHKANQLCWICDERRTCTRQPQGWECVDCRDIQ